MSDGPFNTRAEALSWLKQHDLEHLLQVSASVLAPKLERFRLLDLASAEGVASQAYAPVPLGPLELPRRAWDFFQAEQSALADARAELEQRLEPPDDARAFELHRRLVALRGTFSGRVPPRAERQLALDRLTPKLELPGFVFTEPLRWEIPGHFGFVDPVVTLALGDPASAQCTCGAARCIHALAAIDTALLWLKRAEDGALLDGLVAKPWDRAVKALADVFGKKDEPEGLTWRLDVDEDDFRLSLTPYVDGKQRPLSKLPKPLPAADAALAAHVENRDEAAMLATLVGHPRVVLATNPNRAVSVERTAVGLVAEERGGPVHLTLGVDGTPLPGPLLERIRREQHHLPLFLWTPSSCRLEQLELSREVREAFGVLTRFGNVFPPEAQKPLLEQLAEAATRIPVTMPRSVLGESVNASAELVVRLELQPSRAVRVELRVRPLPESDAYLPAQGPRDVHVRRGAKALHAVRRFSEEKDAASRLTAQLPLEEAEVVEDFVFELPSAAEALELIATCERLEPKPAYEWVGEPVRLLGVAGPKELRVSVDRRDREWFGLFGELHVYGERVSLAVALDAARRRRRFVRVTEHGYVELTRVLEQQLQALDAHAQPSAKGPAVGASAVTALNALLEAGAKLDVDDDFRALTERIAATRGLTVRVPKALKGRLRDYQREGFEWLARLSAWGAGGVLADDMGLGKTVQALALLLHRARLGPQAVLCPTSVAFNWEDEVRRFAPSLKLHRELPQRPLGKGDLVVATYGTARRLEGLRFATLVLDEAQALKNAATQRARAVRGLEADFTVALTGTPLENHLGELWSLFRIVLPELFGGWDAFRDRFAIPIEKGIDPASPARLSNVLAPFVLRRTKAQVARELPPRTEVRVPVSLSSEEWQLYEDARLAVLSDLETPSEKLKEEERKVQVLAALTRLRLLASHPKLYEPNATLRSSKMERLLELVRTLMAEGQRALVFSQFTSHLELVRQVLGSERVTYRYLDGATPAADRAEEVRAFQQGSDPLFLISLKAGGVGLNLTAAENVIHLDPWWNPAVEDQASDRAHRIGQTRPVTVYRLVSLGTIEEKVLALHAKKRALFETLLEGKGAAAKLSSDELLELMRGGRP